MFIAGLRYGFADELETLIDSVRRFATTRIAPRAAQIDRDNAFPHDLWPELGKLGLLGITAPPEYGGAGMGYLALRLALRTPVKDTKLQSDSLAFSERL